MIPKTKAAIEEAAEKSTEKGYSSDHPAKWHYNDGFKNGIQEVIEHPERYMLHTNDYLVSHVNEVANEAGKVAIEIERRHTAAHTAALRDQIADLERENNNYRIVYDSVVKNRDELRERVKELEAKIASYESAIDGLKKVVDSLAKMKSL